MEQKRLMNELMRGKEMAKQLTHHFRSGSSGETRLFLIGKLLSSYEKSISLLKSGPSDDGDINLRFHGGNSDGAQLDSKNKNSRRQIRKRKTLPKWTERVKVCSGNEGHLTDGHSWRKYGQKDIHGAHFPRCYYRCTHRHGRGCWATKQIQRSDEDRTVFEITYIGTHTCTQVSQSGAEAPGAPTMPDGEISNFEVKIEGSEVGEDEVFPSLCSSNGSEIAEQNIFTDLLIENSFPFCPSPPPPSSESYDFPATEMNTFRPPIYNVHTPEFDLPQIISSPIPLSNTPFDDFDFDFDSNLAIDSTMILF